MDDFEKELKVGFLEEAKQSAADVEQCFLSLESDPNDSENLNKIFRLAHNLKGSSKAVGFHEFGRFTHEFETFILKIKNQEIRPTPKAINILLASNDYILQMIDGLMANLDATFDFEDLLSKMRDFNDNEVEVEVEEISTPIEVQLQTKTETPVDPIVNELVVEKKPIENRAHVDGHQDHPQASNKSKNNSAPVDDSLRVSLSKIENLVNSVGEMVILQSGLKEQAVELNSPSLKRIVQHLSKVSKEIQEISMGLRMVPIKPIFQKMQRIVRDTSHELGKDIDFRLEGENTEIDKTILERISDPLVHLIRNSVDHGIESTEARKEKGKPTKGKVYLKAFQQSGKLVIEVSDDGGGLNPEKLKKKAIEKGLIPADNKLSDKDAQNLIFAPGFSTKEKVTDVSGRGVGMDVVKTNIQELGGEVHIESTVNMGTTFKIVLPLTLAIVDAMILTYGPEKFVIPISQVHETLKLNSDILKESSMGTVLLLRDEIVPLFRLGDFFGFKTQKKNTEMIAVVVRSSVKTFAFLVDDIVGQSQVVLKQLGTELQGLTGISGSTILGDGRPAFILEAQDLLKRKIVPTDTDTSSSKRTAA